MPYKFGGEGIFDRSPWTFFVVFGGFLQAETSVFLWYAYFFENYNKKYYKIFAFFQLWFLCRLLKRSKFFPFREIPKLI